MADKYFAKLMKKDDTISLHILKNQKDEGKLVFSSNETDKMLKKLQGLLNISSFKTMMQLAEHGDELTFSFDREFQQDIGLPFDKIETIIKQFNVDTGKTIKKEIYQEVYNNFLSDLIASSMESLYEQLIYQIFNVLDDLALKNLIIVTDGFEDHDRLITLIAKYAPLMDLELSLNG